MMRFWGVGGFGSKAFRGNKKETTPPVSLLDRGGDIFPLTQDAIVAKFEGVQFGITELKDDMILVKCFIPTSHDQKNPKFGSFLEGKTPIFQGPKSR